MAKADENLTIEQAIATLREFSQLGRVFKMVDAAANALRQAATAEESVKAEARAYVAEQRRLGDELAATAGQLRGHVAELEAEIARLAGDVAESRRVAGERAVGERDLASLNAALADIRQKLGIAA